jgi:hypothetical protein
MNDNWFEDLAALAPSVEGSAASTCAKSRLYSRLIAEQEKQGPLAPLSETLARGGDLCVFERIVEIAPVDSLQTFQYCKVCHARVLGERVENAPIFWPHCPYSEFQK